MVSLKPMTLGELQLYKVLQRANLLSYYESFIAQGGDDVQQLCEAGEEEFLEIMSLVGMGCKPLHVRRLQKSLQEWVTRPSLFNSTNIHYLPAQSISLTSLGIDMRDLVMPPQNNSQCSSSTSGNREQPTAIQDDELPQSRPLSANGSATATTRISNGCNIMKLNETAMRANGNSTKSDKIAEKYVPIDAHELYILDSVVQKYVLSNPNPLEKREVLSQLIEDRAAREIGLAFRSNDQKKAESLVGEFVKKNLNFGSGGSDSRHEALVADAAVKLCMADEGWVLKRNELAATAERLASEVESKLPSRRRSSTHLHGSTSQSRMQELSQSIQAIKNHRISWQKRLAEAQSSKNVIKENDCQNNLERISREETVLLQEKKELREKMMKESGETGSSTASMESFSNELAELAKAHNLSLGNLQSVPSSSCSWPSSDAVSSTSPNGTVDGISQQNSSANVQNNSGGDDFPLQGLSRPPPELLQIKQEEIDGDSASTPATGRSNKRKLSNCSLNNENSNNCKKLITGAGTENE